MEYNKESFKKALKDCGIIRWENHFEKVVKAYLKAEAEQLPVVVGRSEQLLAFKEWERDKCRLPWDAEPKEIVEQYLSQ